MTASGRPGARAISLALVAIISVAWDVPAAAGDDRDNGTPSAAARDEALNRFRRGVAVYEEGDFSAAHAELTRAYELAPNFKVLFNLAQVAHQRRDYAAALDYLTRYLRDGGERVPASRRLEVEADLAELRQRVGYLGVQVPEAGLVVVIDDIERGTTPLEAPAVLNAGRHRVELVVASGERHARMVDVPGGQTVSVTFNLKRGVEPKPAAAPLPAPAPSLPARAEAARPMVLLAPPSSEESAGEGRPQRRWSPWVAWTLTAACAVGAAAMGAMALSTSFELQRKLDSYPVSQRELDSLGQREREFALASDGLLLGTVVLSAISLYLTMSGPAPAEAKRSAHALPPERGRASPPAGHPRDVGARALAGISGF